MQVRTIVLALIASAAFLAPTVAQAGEFYTGTGGPATLTGAQTVKHELSTAAGVLKCNTATFHGVASGESGEQKITPTYSGCTIAGLGATVNMNGCDYKFTAKETTGGTETVDAETHVICPVGNTVVVKITGSTCEVHFGTQTIPQSGVLIHNRTGFFGWLSMSTQITWNWSQVRYTVLNSPKCPNKPSEGEYENGTYKGESSTVAEAVGGGAEVDWTVR